MIHATGKAIKFIRDLNNREQADIAQSIGIHPSLLCHIEKGRRKCKPKYIEKFVEAIGITMEDFKEIEKRITNEITGLAN